MTKQEIERELSELNVKYSQEKQDQDKISFAIKQLQYLIDEEFEVEYLNDYNSEAKIEYVPCEKIENLINQLKEMK